MKDDTKQVHMKMFEGHDAGRARRVKVNDLVADVVYSIFKPKSVIDLGCGLGFFLASMQARGSEVSAVDNDWVKDLETALPLDAYTFHDLNDPFASSKRYALATSFEVAEHLNPKRSDDFVAELCALSDRVAFSAAIPRQGGKGHINLQWQSAWAERFATHGYDCYDAIRPAIGEHPWAHFWFRQNPLIYIKQGTPVPAAIKNHRISTLAADLVSRKLFNRRLAQAEKTIAGLRAEIASLKGEA